MIPSIIFVFCLAVACYVLWRQAQARINRQRAFEAKLATLAQNLLDECRRSHRDSKGTFTYEGDYQGEHTQIRFIIDNLATRKLPVLWLSLSYFGATKLTSTYDLLNRPAGLASFSNFDTLPFERPLPRGLEGQRALRADDANTPSDIADLRFMLDDQAKEFVASAKGVRAIWSLAEADRLRYGTMRNADFHDVDMDSALVQSRLDLLLPIFLELHK